MYHATQIQKAQIKLNQKNTTQLKNNQIK